MTLFVVVVVSIMPAMWRFISASLDMNQDRRAQQGVWWGLRAT